MRARGLFPSLAVLGLAVLALGALSRRTAPLQRYAVEGRSMEPSFRPGDFLLVWCPPRPPLPRPGQAVLVRDPREPSRVLLKRAAAVDPARGLWLLGDRPELSTDSRAFGPVPLDHLVGRVLFRYWPLRRR